MKNLKYIIVLLIILTFVGQGYAGDFIPKKAIQLKNTPAGNIAATNVQAAINELDTEKISTESDPQVGDVTDTYFGVCTGTTIAGNSKATMDADGKQVHTATMDNPTGDEVAWTLNYTTDKLTSGDDIAWLIQQTDTRSPGTSYGINYKVGASSKFSINNYGLLTIAGTNTMYFDAPNGQIRMAAGQSMQILPGSGNTLLGISLYGTNGYNALTSGSHVGVSVINAYNQASGTAANTDLLINRTRTAVGSGAQYAIDTQVGSASKWTIGEYGKEIHRPQTVTCTDSGADADPKACPITPTGSYIEVDCQDDDHCTCTISETGAEGGQILTIVSVGSYQCQFADSVGSQNLAGAMNLAQHQSISFYYSATLSEWVNSSRSSN